MYEGPTIVFPNRAPEILEITGPVDPIEIGAEAQIVAAYTDRNAHDTHTAEVDWGDGSPGEAAAVTFDLGDGTAAASHVYEDAGVYTVTVTVTDAGGLSDTDVFQYVVVYDPDGAFVTGGGGIDSPAGAYVPDPSLEGDANFGFVSKYKRGADVPTGNTEFQFHAGDLNFHSDEYQWLVVAGAKAMFKGTGTINGEAGYGFLITAIDADLTASTDIDLFRIKIWIEADDTTVVYDNMLGADDDADPTTELASGSIVVHTAKKAK